MLTSINHVVFGFLFGINLCRTRKLSLQASSYCGYCGHCEFFLCRLLLALDLVQSPMTLACLSRTTRVHSIFSFSDALVVSSETFWPRALSIIIRRSTLPRIRSAWRSSVMALREGWVEDRALSHFEIHPRARCSVISGTGGGATKASPLTVRQQCLETIAKANITITTKTATLILPWWGPKGYSPRDIQGVLCFVIFYILYYVIFYILYYVIFYILYFIFYIVYFIIFIFIFYLYILSLYFIFIFYILFLNFCIYSLCFLFNWKK